MVGWVDRRLPAEVVEQWCGRVFGAEYAAVVAGLVRPALHLVRAEPGADVAFSLGGAPRSSGPWPVHPELGPMEFVARLDLSVVAEAGVCPALTATGVVEVFVPPSKTVTRATSVISRIGMLLWCVRYPLVTWLRRRPRASSSRRTRRCERCWLIRRRIGICFSRSCPRAS